MGTNAQGISKQRQRRVYRARERHIFTHTRANTSHPNARPPPPRPQMTYLETAVEACKAINDRSGVSLQQMKAYFSSNKKGFKNHMLLKALKTGVANGTLAMHHQKKGSYKVGAAAPKPKKKKVVKKKKAAPKYVRSRDRLRCMLCETRAASSSSRPPPHREVAPLSFTHPFSRSLSYLSPALQEEEGNEEEEGHQEEEGDVSPLNACASCGYLHPAPGLIFPTRQSLCHTQRTHNPPPSAPPLSSTISKKKKATKKKKPTKKKKAT